MVENIIIGTPLVSLESLGIDINTQDTVFDTERFLPKLLVKYGIAPSISEIKRNKRNLVKNLDKPDFGLIKFGKKRVWIVVGE